MFDKALKRFFDIVLWTVILTLGYLYVAGFLFKYADIYILPW